VETAPLVPPDQPCARFSGLVATQLVEVSNDPAVLQAGGRWAVLMTYEGKFTAARFRRWRAAPPEAVAAAWRGPDPDAWQSSMDQAQFEAAVSDVREQIARGTVYQACVCRVLSAPLDPAAASLGGLHALLARGNPAPYEGYLRIPGLEVATASPELFLRRAGDAVRTGPIKGTGRTSQDLLAKDLAENVMIVDLMRNDLSRVCEPGSVRVPRLLAQEQHPGLVHLVSEVVGELRQGVGWPELFAATMPPGSVSGAPKSSAVRILRGLEPVQRGPYCGTVGWVDADTGEAVLAVAIRTFWRDGDLVRLGTGAGITWGSDPTAEWRETGLKASRLLQVAGQQYLGPGNTPNY
jgi:para-aminobenzoate synthetase component 1